MSHIVGIDLGTTHSLCAVFTENGPRLVPNALGGFLTPSVVACAETAADAPVLVGAAARDVRVTAPERAAVLFKRHMGTERTISFADRTLTAPELSALVLRSLKEDAEAFLGEPVTEAVITVPAYFSDLQRQATVRAGRVAGLTVRRIVNEPTAAALVHGLHEADAEKRILVLDLGGGTFDVTLMDVFEGSLEIVATAGESFLGGEDFTDRIVAWVLERHGLQFEGLALSDAPRVARLREEAETAKRRLSESDTALVRLPAEGGEFRDAEPGLELTRATFEELTAPLAARILAPVLKVLRDARLDAQAIDEVLLVGGATRMPLVRRIAAERFPHAPARDGFDPDHVVALGAAVQAALIAGDAAVADLVMTDVCPFTLGVEVSKVFGKRAVEGFYMPIIHRNTTIPVSREESVYTMYPGQTFITVEVFQGESRRVEDNIPLGSLRVSGIPPGPAEKEVRLRFTYDLNGILEVEAIIDETGRRFRTVLTNHAQGLGDDEVAAAVERMQTIKFYPRDDQVAQALLRHAARTVGEVAPHDRGDLEQILDVYERAMRTADRGGFAAARRMLLDVLERLGFPFE